MTMPETLSVGTTVYIPSVTTKHVPVVCPDCRDEHKWLISTPSGHKREIDCPRCHGGTTTYEWLRPRRHERTLVIAECVITEASVRQRRDHKDASTVHTSVHYAVSPGLGSIYPDRIFTSRDLAEEAGAKLLAADAERENEDWRKELKRGEDRAGMDIMAALEAKAFSKQKALSSNIDTLRDKMLEAIRYPTLYGPKLARRSYGGDELTSQALADWLNGLLNAANLDGWSESDLHEALCDCA